MLSGLGSSFLNRKYFRSALGVGQNGQNNMEIRRAPMRRLKKFPEPVVQLETKPIAVSEDEKFVEF